MRFFVLWILGVSCLWAQEEKKLEGRIIPNIVKRLVGENSGNRFFYYPTKTGPHQPDKYGYDFEEITFSSEDGTKLHGWYMPAKKVAKGSVVFSHGNAGAVGHHLGFCTWLVRAGYNVLLYDYRAYGKSEGEVDRKGIVQDVRAAFGYLKSRADVDATRLFSFGHSLGGAKSIAALGEKPVAGLRGVISFAGFSSYRKMAKKVAGAVGAGIVSDDYAPIDYVEKLAPIPVLIAHGKNDRVVPFAQGEELFAKAKDPKTFFAIKDGGHNRALWRNDKEYEKKILAWMDARLKSPLPKAE